jgi:hypothetical protein
MRLTDNPSALRICSQFCRSRDITPEPRRFSIRLPDETEKLLAFLVALDMIILCAETKRASSLCELCEKLKLSDD